MMHTKFPAWSSLIIDNELSYSTDKKGKGKVAKNMIYFFNRENTACPKSNYPGKKVLWFYYSFTLVFLEEIGTVKLWASTQFSLSKT